ncbi:MAG: 16S rRNA (guanine(966)-N(2))-methyltransferase RsmD [Symbiobacteriaceae bacterium]|nr:16S rRNA (guanine(966)-N(2))-methyltransferase RsmD [Symbiobacteriaceae bacterium]
MRVIAGACKGRKLLAAPGLHTRPTSDILKGVIFNILGWRVVASQVVDICAGGGSLGIEALSRGASQATFFEDDPLALKVLHRNLELCSLEAVSTVIPGDARESLLWWQSPTPCNLVLLDPPYSGELVNPLLEILGSASWLAPEAIVILEHHRKIAPPVQVGFLEQYRQSGHGQSMLSFYSHL